MPKFRLNVTVEHKGVIFDAAQSAAAAARMVIAINDSLAEEAVRRIKARLGQVLQNPTGFYESRITVDRSQTARSAWDQGVVYGGWLEGVASRNQTTRFKGYRTFRIVRQEMQEDKAKLAQPAVTEFVKEMNG